MRRVHGSIVLLAALAGLAGCGNRNMPMDDAGTGRRCTTAAECDDGFACTVDNCGVDMRCAYTPIDAVCTGAGEHCVVGVGCSTMQTCTTSAQCDDGFDCTVDACGAGNVCTHMGVNALCTDPMMPTCEVGRGCVSGGTRCTSSADCNDSVACTVDTCTPAATCQNMPLDSLCDAAAGERCTSSGCFAPMTCTTEEECQDGNFCNGRERCLPELGCQPATMAPRCDDGMACTVDTCEPATGCVYTCDSANPSCTCMGDIDCTGRFMLSERLFNQCIDDGSGGYQVDYDIGLVDIAIVAGQTLVTPVAPDHAHFGTLSDASASCPSVTATASVSGGTTERYTLTVTFSDSDHFSGTFNANLGGLGGLLGCTEGSIPITGTRM
ncbi:MAG: hypothetical protein K1X94_18825 [Sandaracinaceae bacterium]|nr:hypothetical protein [Sandaracinaceae bacterium]